MNANAHMKTMKHAGNGFSLIELIVIIMIIGILALFVRGRFAEHESFDARGYYDQLVAATRYAQRYAVASGCTVRMAINASDYAVTTRDAACGVGTSVQLPAGGAFAANAPSGVGVTGDLGNYDFDARGGVNAGGSITVSGGGSTLTFTVTPVSGFVVTP